MQLLKSLSRFSLGGMMSRRHVLGGVGVLAASASGASQAQAQGVPSHLKFSNPDGISKPSGYTHVVEVTGPSRTVYIAGQLGWDGTGKRAGEPGDFKAQATQVFENLQTALRSAGAGFEHVVKLNTYTTNMANMPIFREVRSKYITGTPPAATAVEISKLARPDALLEVEVVAVVAMK